ncbi:MAG: hypothetical protein LM589_01525 [Thermosphaera sp.]|nr:hypothetical protein [Thermosphaera sp.]
MDLAHETKRREYYISRIFSTLDVDVTSKPAKIKEKLCITVAKRDSGLMILAKLTMVV